MPSWYAGVPEGVDFTWCPAGCGETTSDPYGGPCRACSNAMCCDLHGRFCEPPSELCCRRCAEVDHPRHVGTTCVLEVPRG